ncbi:MAG: acylneuraminate cytidylyltransferase [Thermoanaerobaculia bacterium]|nr:acylneuraminate cytidylyltransferase [Thermoanaerobaculia bacterium]
MDHERILALIPARGGSKGIPRKNLAPFGGRPLLAWTIEQARSTPEIARVVVSTDDDEIATVARTWGAEVIRRPESLAGDEASSESALAHALDALAADGYEPDLVVFLQATSPLRRPGEISRALASLEAAGADSLFSASTVHGFVWRQNSQDLQALTYDSASRPRRQDIGEDLLENGSIYVFEPWVLREHGNRLGGKIAIHRMDPLDSFQVDDPGDLETMERLLAVRPVLRPMPDLAVIRLLVLDFDGVLSDDRVVVREDGLESVVCHRGDGMGLELLRKNTDIGVVVLSKETNPVVAARCRKLRIPCHQGYERKLPQLEAVAREHGLRSHQVAYVGNDVNDLEPMAWCGVSVAVADARPEVRRAADLVTQRPGGRGAVREICDLFLDTVD